MVNLDDVFGHGDLHAVAWFEASPLRFQFARPLTSCLLIRSGWSMTLTRSRCGNPGHHIRPPNVRSVHVALRRPQRSGERLVPVLIEHPHHNGGGFAGGNGKQRSDIGPRVCKRERPASRCQDRQALLMMIGVPSFARERGMTI